MKKMFSIGMISLIILSTFSMFTPRGVAEVSLPWRDDFDYQTKQEMKDAGWILGGEERISVGGGIVGLDNDGSHGSSVRYLGNFPSGINDFSVEAKSKWIGRAYGQRVFYVWTQRHRYGWYGDGYYPEYSFIRYSDGWSGEDVKVLRFGGYAPVINEWATFTLEKRGNTFYMYEDGILKNTYTEADSAPDELVGVSISGGWISTVEYDHISVEVPSAVRAWKDDTSFGLENDHLKLEGDYSHYNHGTPWFNYLLFKDTGTTWTSPWDDIIRCIPITWKATGSVDVKADMGTEDASITLTFSTTYYASTTLTVTTEFWITTEPYVRITMHITNSGSQASDPFSPSLGYYTFIAGDTTNDYYYIPGFGQGPYTGTQQNLDYTPTEPWMAAWDQNKEEGVGVVFTEGYSFSPDYVHIHDWYGLTAVAQGGWGYSEIQLEVGETSKDQAYLYFFTGTGWQKTKDFCDSLIKPRILDVPYQDQGHTQWCGPACLAMMLRYYGIWFHILYYITPWRGIPPLEGTLGMVPIGWLKDYVEKYYPWLTVIEESYATSEEMSKHIFADIKSNISSGFPVILRIQKPSYGHFIVVTGYNETGLFVNDPSGAVFSSVYLNLPTVWDFQHAFISWDNWEILKQHIPTGWLGPATLSIHGDPQPIDGTLYFLGDGDIRLFRDVDSYSFLDLDWGLTWKQWDRYRTRGVPVWNPIIDSSNENLHWEIWVSNTHGFIELFEISFHIVGSDGLRYYSETKTIEVDGYKYGARAWTTQISEKLKKSGQYFVQVDLWDSEGNLADTFSSPNFYYLISGILIKLQEDSQKLYLHVYDERGNHVGINYSTNETEIEIPEAYYFDLANTTFIILPYNMRGFQVAVDGQYAHEPIETYNLLLSITKDKELIEEVIADTIKKGEIQDFRVQLDPGGKPKLIERTFYPEWGGKSYPVTIESNSTVSNFNFNQSLAQISFNVTGLEAPTCFCNITIPKTLMWVDTLGEWNVTIDGTPLRIQERTVTYNGTHYFIYFMCSTSTITIQVVSKYVVPEFPLFIILPLFMLATLIAFIIYKRRRAR